MSRLVEWQMEKLVSRADKRIALFYCSNKDGDLRGTEPRTVIRAFIRQLGWSKDGSQPSQRLEVAYRRGRTDGLAHDYFLLSRCIDLLTKILSVFDCTIINIDAFDECSDPNELLELLQEIASKLRG